MALSTITLAAFLVAFVVSQTTLHDCKCVGTQETRNDGYANEQRHQIPRDSCWPSPSVWDSFNASIAGKLIANTPPAIPCYPGPAFNADTCAALVTELTDPNFITNSTVALDFPTFISCPVINITAGDIPGRCTLGQAPVFTVDAHDAVDVAAGVNFARAHNLRLVVRNTGHDLLGR
jgi:hypothetical protein